MLKAGVNKWEEIWQLDMRKPEGLAGVDGDWWCVDLDLTEVGPVLEIGVSMSDSEFRGSWQGTFSEVQGGLDNLNWRGALACFRSRFAFL